MRRRMLFFMAAVIGGWGLFFFTTTAVLAQAVSLSIGGQRLSKTVKSLKEIQREGVVLQELDYSCGAAAMATLLTYHHLDPVNEGEVTGFIFIHGQTPEEGLKRYFRRQGFSLLDLKRFAEFRGYKVAGYKEMDVDDLIEFLEQDRLPVIVPINTFGYSHFVVVRGVVGNRIYMADPATGKATMTIARFADVWVEGIALIVSRGELARARAGRRTASADPELDRVTAAGSASKPEGGQSAASSPLLTIGPDEGRFPDSSRYEQAFQNRAREALPRLLQTIDGTLGDHILGLVELQNYNPVIQFGRPAGNFIDFTPPSGQINIQPSPDQTTPPDPATP